MVSRSVALRPCATMLSVTLMRSPSPARRATPRAGRAARACGRSARVDSRRSEASIMGCVWRKRPAILPWSTIDRRTHAVPSAALAPAAHQRGRDARADRAAAGRGEHGNHGAADRPRLPLGPRPTGDPRHRKSGWIAGAVRPDRHAGPPPRRRARGACACGDPRGRRVGRLLACVRGGRDPRQCDEHRRIDRRARRRVRVSRPADARSASSGGFTPPAPTRRGSIRSVRRSRRMSRSCRSCSTHCTNASRRGCGQRRGAAAEGRRGGAVRWQLHAGRAGKLQG